MLLLQLRQKMEVKIAVDRYFKKTLFMERTSFSEIRHANGVLDRPLLPADSPVQLYGELEAALHLLRLVPNAEAYEVCEEIKIYMKKLHTTLQEKNLVM